MSMTSRSRRNSKVVDYAAVEKAFSDDDDFSDFTPPLKKKKEDASGRKESDKENSSSVSKDVVETSTQMTSKKKTSQPRMSVEERKFQRELEMALELSAQKAKSEDFPGFEEGKMDDVLDSFSPIKVTAEIHPLPSEEAEKKVVHFEEKGIFNEIDYLEKEKTKCGEEIIPCPLQNESKANKPKKKVNFVEDDDSDDWNSSSSDDDDEPNSKSETDESDFFPSPIKKKKKEPKIVTPKPKKVKEPPKSKKEVERKPLNVKQEVCSVVTSNAPSTKSPVVASVKSDPTPTLPSTPKSIPCAGLVKKPFKCPTINPSSSPAQTSSSVPGRIGLRLGLSRKGYVKPLHPNASVK